MGLRNHVRPKNPSGEKKGKIIVMFFHVFNNKRGRWYEKIGERLEQSLNSTWVWNCGFPRSRERKEDAHNEMDANSFDSCYSKLDYSHLKYHFEPTLSTCVDP